MQNKGDQGLAIGFRRSRDINQPWSRDSDAVADGIRRIVSRADASLDGTSLFDSLWSTCHYEFRGQQEDVQNILLLFSDGIDTSSHATLEQAVGACQQAHTSVFALTSTPDLSDLSMGHRTLRKLTEQTGGSVILCGGFRSRSQPRYRRTRDRYSQRISALLPSAKLETRWFFPSDRLGWAARELPPLLANPDTMHFPNRAGCGELVATFGPEVLPASPGHMYSADFLESRTGYR